MKGRDEPARHGGGLEPPYGVILQELEAGRVVPFLGAASSRLVSAEQSPQPPAGAQLAEMLAREASFPMDDPAEYGDLAKVASYYVDGSNRRALHHKLRTIFVNQSYSPNELHAFLASLPLPLVIVTTNYDTLMEQAFDAVGKPYDVAVYQTDDKEFANGVLWWGHGEAEPRRLKPNALDVDEIGKTNLIYKIHGTVKPTGDRWDSFVITEDDYVRFLSRTRTAVPAAFIEYFKERPFLFLGYGLRDWNMRVMLKRVGDRKARSWALQHRPSALERKLWERRQVDIYDVTLEEFVKNIRPKTERRP